MRTNPFLEDLVRVLAKTAAEQVMTETIQTKSSAAPSAEGWYARYSRGENLDGFIDWVRESPQNAGDFETVAGIMRLAEAVPIDVEAAVNEALNWTPDHE